MDKLISNKKEETIDNTWKKQAQKGANSMILVEVYDILGKVKL